MKVWVQFYREYDTVFLCASRPPIRRADLRKGKLGEGEVWLVSISIDFPFLLLTYLQPVASFAALSASSFSPTPMCAGIHRTSTSRM